MAKPPQKRSAKLKMQLAIESLKGEQSITQIASEHGIHPKQIRRWRDQLLAEGYNPQLSKSCLGKGLLDFRRL